MRKLLIVAGLTALMFVPAAAQAGGWLIEGSIGKGGVVTSPRQWDQVNFMLAPGWSPSLPLLSYFRLQLGVAADFADKKGSNTNIELRPMLTFDVPLLPLYVRAVVSVQNLRKEDGHGVLYSYGPAVGTGFGLGPIGIFAEVGALGRKEGVTTGPITALSNEDKWRLAIEGRVGVKLDF
jgi:hypothetical protein